MPRGFKVQGPCVLEWDPLNTGASWAELGVSGNDDMFAFDVEYANNIVGSTDTGDEPAEIVYNGVIGVLTARLVNWDPVEIAAIQQPPGATKEGEAGIIGERWVSAVATGVTTYCFGLRIQPRQVDPTRDVYTFPRCMINGPQGLRLGNFGNLEQTVSLQFLVFRDSGTAGTIGDGAIGTEVLYTVAPSSA